MKPAPIQTRQTGQELILSHPRMELRFDMERGTWSAFDTAARLCVLKDAGWRLDQRGDKSWPRPPMRYTIRSKSCRTGFGSGMRVTMTAKPKAGYQPTVMIHWTVYADQPFVEIGWSIRNHQAQPVRVREVEVLCNAVVLPKKTLKDAQHLDGGAGAAPNPVQAGWEGESHNNLMVTGRIGRKRRTLVAGGLQYSEFARRVELLSGERFWSGRNEPKLTPTSEPRLTLVAWDPQGKRIDPGTTYHAEDTTYLDFLTTDPFESLETYGASLRQANRAEPHVYDFPTLCGWMVSTKHLGEGKPINHSSGLVEQVEIAREQGLMRYTPLAARLEPDYYCFGDNGNTQQGWWDDEHFAKYGALSKPHDSFREFCQAVTERGGVPFTYVQTSMPSNDFALAHPEWMLRGDISELHRPHAHHRPHVRYDYSDPGFQKYMQKVWARLRKAGLKGVKFDYPESGWAAHGGFDDPYTTTTAAYRTIFQLCKDGLGPESFVHERNLGGITHESAPCLDVTAGIADLQRVWGDASHFEPEMASRMGLRWYKSRSVYIYYPDGKSFYEKGKALAAYRRRAFLTLIGFLGGRIEIGTSIGSMTPEMFHDLTRMYPVFGGTRSPRPVDMLLGKAHPEVYAYAVTPDWHQVLLVNNHTRTRTITAPLGGNRLSDGGLELERKARYHAFDFWSQSYIGLLRGSGELSARLRGGEVAMISLRKAEAHPQPISTNRHYMQGMLECHDVRWQGKRTGLTGAVDVVGGEPFVLTVALNGASQPTVTVDAGEAEVRPRPDGKGLVDVVLRSGENRRIGFRLR